MASPIIVTATVQDITSTDLNNPTNSSAFVRFRLRNFQGFVPQVSGTSILAETLIDSLPGASGAISQLLWGNNSITPANTFYTVEQWSKGRITSSGNYIFNANTNLDSAAPVNPAPPPQSITSLLIEVNGAPASSQSLLNLENGSVTVVDNGGGNITFNSGNSGLGGSGAYFYGPGVMDEAVVLGGSDMQGQTLNSSAGVLQCYLFQLGTPFTVSKISQYAGGSQANVHGYFGIYSYAGNLLVNGGQFAYEAVDNIQTNTITPVTLPAGTYWHVQATDHTATGIWNGVPISSAAIGSGLIAMHNANTARIATAANTLSGALPATLGALTPFTPQSGGDNIMCPLYE